MKKKLIIIISILAALAVIGLVGYRIGKNYIEDYTMKSLVETELNSMIDSGEMTVEELEQTVESITALEGSEAEPQAENAPGDSEQTKPEEGQNSEAPKTETPKKEAPKAEASGSGNKQPASANTDNNKNDNNKKSKKEVVSEASEKITQRITRSEKEEMMNFVFSRLTSSDIAYLRNLAKDGITPQDKSDAYKIAVSRFSSAELAKIKSFYHRYIGR